MKEFGKKNKKGDIDTDNTLSNPVVKPEKKGKSSKKKSVKRTPKAIVSSQSEEEKRVPVTSVVLGKLVIKDAPSGEEYIFENAGAVVPVRAQDIEHFRSKNRKEAGGGCCPGTFMRKYFEIPV